MNKISILVFLALSLVTFGQEKYSNEDLSIYKKIIHENSTKYKHIIELEKGQIIRSTTYWNKNFRSINKYYYDENSNVTQIDLVDFYVKDTSTYDSAPIIYINKYNNLNQLTSIIEITSVGKKKHNSETEFSNYNSKGLPQKITHSIYTQDLVYDTKGNIIKKTTIWKAIEGVTEQEIETIDYTYDKHNNVTSLSRKITPEVKFPIEVMGGRFKYEFERFRYKYNRHGHWTKKYWIVEEKEILLEKRKFEK